MAWDATEGLCATYAVTHKVQFAKALHIVHSFAEARRRENGGGS